VQKQTVTETVASNIRARRHFRGMEQAELAVRMQSLGFAWRRATVSDIERNKRNVSLTEALGLAVALGTTIEELIDTRGGGQRGPHLLISDRPPLPDGPIESFDRRVDLPPASVSALVCPHKLYAETEWVDDNVFSSILIQPVDEDAR
jgi:transcriptional regulator with XRE-family HTH domain